jgi:uncharacterized membrane protein YidH (DUF202 family)
MPRPDGIPEHELEEHTPSLVAAVLTRLPEADRRRAQSRRRQAWQRTGAALLATALLLACLGPQTSNAATQGLASLLAAGDAWQTLVRVLLGGAILLPLLSTLALVGLSLVLWEQFLQPRNRGLR